MSEYKTVELLKLIQSASVAVTAVKKVSEAKAPEPGMIYQVSFDTPFDGGAGSAQVYITEDRAIELGLVEAPAEDIPES